MTAPVFTPEQRAAIERREGALLVSANAGSGKTSVMVERFVQAVSQDDVAVDAILALTFTDKAAGLLRERVRAGFSALGEDERARASESAHISTIHGFCARVLGTHALRSGLDPRVRVFDEQRSDRAMRPAFDRAFADLVAARGEAALALGSAYATRDLRELCKTLYARLRSRGETRPRLPAPPPAAALEPLHAQLAQARSRAAACLEGARDLAAVVAAREALDACRELLPAQPDRPAALLALEAMEFKPGSAGELQDPACSGYLEALAAYRRSCVDRLALPAYELIGELVKAFGTRYEELKRDASALDFDDLELGVRDLFSAQPAVADSYARRFELVMVDELQDTNQRQLEILDRIARDNLFAVGDEHQSIYGFRHAEVELFRRRRAALNESGAALSLEVNFRSDEHILDAINAAFDPLFEHFLPLRAGARPSPDGEGPLVELLVTERSGWEADDDAAVDVGERLPGAALWRVAEARMLAHRLRDLIDATRYGYGDVVVLLRATGDMGLFERALEDRGIPTYLVGGRGYWSHRQVQDVVAWLSVLANPDDELRLFEVLASPLCGVSSDALVLVAMAAQRQSRTLWWALREAVGGDGSDGLLERLANGDRQRVVELVQRIERERAAMRRASLEALIERAVSETGYDLAVLAMPGGPRRLANVRKLMRLAREHEREEGRDLRGFLDLVAELAEDRFGGSREGEAPVESDAPAEGDAVDAVRIMTVHRAKGLEFPVVCVADLGRATPAGGRELLRVGGDGAEVRVGLRLRTLEGAQADAFDYQRLAAEQDAAAFEEEQRLFYVAVTRAQERLILSGAVRVERWPDSRPGCPPIAWLAPAFAPQLPGRLNPEEPEYVEARSWNGRTTHVRCVLNSPATIGMTLPREALAPPLTTKTPDGGRGVGSGGTWAEPPEAATGPRRGEPPGLPSVPQVSYSALESYARCGYRYYLEHVLGLPQETTDTAPGGLPATLRGTLVHELLEEFDFARPASPPVAQIIERAGAHGAGLSEPDARELIGLLDAFGASDLCARLASADEVRRERRFAFPLDAGGREPLLVTGVVDAIARDHERVLIVDYKTDRLGDREPARVVEDAYMTQRLVYALAALRDGAAEVEIVHCFLERPGEVVSASFAQVDTPALEAQLALRAAGLLAGEFAVTPQPFRGLCQTCPGRAALCSWEPTMTLRESPS